MGINSQLRSWQTLSIRIIHYEKKRPFRLIVWCGSTPRAAQHILVFIRFDDFFQDKNADRMNGTCLIVSYIELATTVHSIFPSSNTVLWDRSNEGDVMSPTIFLFFFSSKSPLHLSQQINQRNIWLTIILLLLYLASKWSWYGILRLRRHCEGDQKACQRYRELTQDWYHRCQGT